MLICYPKRQTTISFYENFVSVAIHKSDYIEEDGEKKNYLFLLTSYDFNMFWVCRLNFTFFLELNQLLTVKDTGIRVEEFVICIPQLEWLRWDYIFRRRRKTDVQLIVMFKLVYFLLRRFCRKVDLLLCFDKASFSPLSSTVGLFLFCFYMNVILYIFPQIYVCN